ncbi:hypothetical protein V6Z11_A09G183900 [Gossypium hirsutum]
MVLYSSSGDSLIVNFGSQELKDMMLNKEEVLARLRFRSMPLQVDDCCHIEEGERVLVNTKLQSKDFFHDAEVEKVDRIRHSKRGCRCSFMIKWLDNDLEGQTLAVPSKMDLNKLLQKQIEQISNLADAPVPEKDFLDGLLLRKKAVPDNRNHLKRTTCSKTKLQVDIETKYQSGTAASIQEEFIQNRSRLSPLASRAALASSLLTAKKCLDMEFSSCMTADMFMKGKHSSEILAISVPLVSDASHAISPPISTQGDASCKPSSCIPTKVTAEISEIAMTAEHAIARDKKSSVHGDVNARPTTPMRLTRLAMRKGAVFPNECIEVKICTDNKKRRISGNKNKLCHSAIRQENENLGNEENNSTHIIDSGSSERNIAILESDVSAPKTAKDASTPCNAKLHTLISILQARMHRVVGEIRARREKQFIQISKANDFHLEIIYPGLAPRINPTTGSN